MPPFQSHPPLGYFFRYSQVYAPCLVSSFVSPFATSVFRSSPHSLFSPHSITSLVLGKGHSMRLLDASMAHRKDFVLL